MQYWGSDIVKVEVGGRQESPGRGSDETERGIMTFLLWQERLATDLEVGGPLERLFKTSPLDLRSCWPCPVHCLWCRPLGPP